MSIKNLISKSLLTAGLIAAASTGYAQDDSGISETTSSDAVVTKTFKEEWSSIAKHSTPEWFRDAKFGIYTCLGPATIATQHGTNEWWGWVMYSKKARYWTNAIRPDSPEVTRDYKRHQEIFGDQNEVGYKELIKMFDPVNFNADEWADLFEEAGAKFAGPLGAFHDNYMMWDSEVTRWNSYDMAGVDIVGELEKAYKKRNMKYLVTFHHAFSWWWFAGSYKYDGGIPGNEDLYNRPHTFSEDNDSFAEYPDAEYEDLWYRKLEECAVKYDPDLYWFDMGLELLSDDIRKKAFARLLNLADERQKDIGLAYKIKFSVPIAPRAGILDYEKGRSTGLREDVWLTDTPLGGWFYNTKPSRSSKAIIEMLVDIVSKNGNLQLCVSPKADGTIPEDQVKTLKEIGAWLDMNGEAIYNTRPWVIAEEGPTKLESDGHFNENWEAIYTNEDIRFTRSKDNNTLYITVLDRPEDGKVIVKKLSTLYPYLDREIENVSLLGTEGSIKWKRNKNGLRLAFPKEAKGVSAWSYKVTLAPVAEKE